MNPVIEKRIVAIDGHGERVPIDVSIQAPFQTADGEWIAAVHLSGLIHRKNDVVAPDPDTALVAARALVKRELNNVSAGSGDLLDA